MRSILPCCLPSGKAGKLQILRCQGIAVVNYSFTLDVLTLKPSDFCKVGVTLNEETRMDGLKNYTPELKATFKKSIGRI